MDPSQAGPQLTPWSRLILLIVPLLAGGVTTGTAQEEPPVNGRALGFGFGLGSAAMSVGGQREPALGVSILGRVGIDRRNRFLLIAEVNPIGVDNPVMDESFIAFNALLGFTIGNSFKVRPSLGMQFRGWSGTDQVVGNDATLLVGLEAGPEFRLGPRLFLSPEVVLRYSLIEPEGNVSSRFIGVQFVMSWKQVATARE